MTLLLLSVRILITLFVLYTLGKHVEGEYHVHEPGGNVRSVKYHAGPHGGFYAEVHNYGGNDHSGGSYGYHKRR